MTTLAGLRPPRSARAGSGSVLRRVDYSLLAVTFAIAALGLLMVFSATRGSAATPNHSFVDRQMTFAFGGVVLMCLVMLIDYRTLRSVVGIAYLATLAVLCAVPVIGAKVNGARAWFRLGPFQLQPSEFGKITVIVALAAFFTIDRSSPTLRNLMVGLGVAGLPAALIMLEPDLGTVLVYIAITTTVFVVAGVRPRHLLLLGLLVVLGTVVTLNTHVLSPYQVNRLTAFVDQKPSKDNVGVFEQQQHAQTAIGNGGLLGQGLFEGSQNKSKLVSQKQTDFIFTVVGEELGFAGAATLLALYGIMILRIWRIGATAPDLFGTLICAGVLAMFMFQIFESVGMTSGIMPITGIPLPFFSYGGSSILTSFLGIGLVESVYLRRFV